VTAQLAAEMRLADANQQTETHSYRALAAGSERELVTWLDEPSKPMPSRRPEHEIRNDLAGDGISCDPVLPGVHPRGTGPGHEFGFVGKRPRLLEQHIRIPLSQLPGKDRGSSGFDFEPALDCGKLNRDIGATRRSALVDVLGRCPAQLENDVRIVAAGSRYSGAEQESGQ